MAVESHPAYKWVMVVTEAVVVIVGLWMMSRGWTDFGLTVVIVGMIGFVVSVVRLFLLGAKSGGA